MKLCIISDTHNKHKYLGILPDADIIIHCGDMTSIGKEHEIHNFMKWFSSLEQYKYKICIAGNHDWLFEKNKLLALTHIPPNIIYLEDQMCEIDGIKFYGTPVQPTFCNWAFNRSEEQLEKYWKAIPEYVDVLITHCPPYMIGDMVDDGSHQGSPSLYNEIIKRPNLILSLYGHIHEGRGITIIDDKTYINASNLDEHYNCVNNPILVEIINGLVNVINY